MTPRTSRRAERGASAAEYGLIIAITIGVIIGAVWGLGAEVAVKFDHVNAPATWYTPDVPPGPLDPVDSDEPAEPTSVPGGEATGQE
jgi:Flp pilus assembly pilin Flp